MYCDANVNEDGASSASLLKIDSILTVTIDESYHVCDKGYLSLFPLLLGLLSPDSPHLGPVLDVLRDPDHLWSPYGLRSLSASHPQFGQGENYWKGPIWIQMNYLALRTLHTVRRLSPYVHSLLGVLITFLQKYAAEEGPQQKRAKEIYDELRRNVVDNVFKVFVSSSKTYSHLTFTSGIRADWLCLGTVRCSHW